MKRIFLFALVVWLIAAYLSAGVPRQSDPLSALNALKKEFKEDLRSGIGFFMMGILLLIAALACIIFFYVIIKLHNRPYRSLLYLGLFTLLYGIRILSETAITWYIFDNHVLLYYISPFVTYIIPIPFILLIKQFTGWGWRSSVRWVLVLQCAYTGARFIFATNIHLEEAINRGTFRKDLYYRLRSHCIHVPPLRERREDIPLLFNYFLEQGGKLLNKKVPPFPPELPLLLSNYTFPGNIRELQAMVYDALARHEKGILSMKSFKEIVGTQTSPREENETLPGNHGENLLKLFNGRFPRLKEVENFLIAEALKIAENNQGTAAYMLGLTRNALNKRLLRKQR